MNSLGRSMALVASSLVFACVVSSVPAAALDRVDGQFWTYDLSTALLGLNATGTISYRLSGHDMVTVANTSYESDLYTVTGNLSASSYLFGVPYTVTSTLQGTRYETRGQASVLMEDMRQWTDASLESAPPELLVRVIESVNTTYVPAYMAGFDSADLRLGSSWEEHISIRTVVVENDTQVHSSAELATYQFAVAGTTESVVVPAGTFDTVRITSTDDHGGRIVYWWSSNAQGFVLEKHYEPLASEPGTILSLRSFDARSSGGLLIPLVVGASVVAVAIVILVILLNARKPKGPVDQNQFDEGLVGSPRLRPQKGDLSGDPAEEQKH